MTTATTEPKTRLLRVSEVMRRLGLSRNSVNALIDQGRLEARRIPVTGQRPSVRVTEASVERVAQGGDSPNAPAKPGNQRKRPKPERRTDRPRVKF